MTITHSLVIAPQDTCCHVRNLLPYFGRSSYHASIGIASYRVAKNFDAVQIIRLSFS